MSAAQIQVLKANLNDVRHADAVRTLINAYAMDPMGEGAPLDADVLDRLIPGLRAHPTTLALLAFADGDPCGVALCFLGFSSFAARPLLNIHDLAVLPAYRGRGVGRALLSAAEDSARALGCCKLTLEVLDKNTVALNAYIAAGFKRYTLQADAGEAIFMSKAL